MPKQLSNTVSGAIAGGITAIVILVISGQGFGGANVTGSTNNNSINDDLLNKINNKAITQEDLVTAAVEKSSPAVVSIIISKDVPIMKKYYTNPFGDSPFGGGFMIPQYKQNGTEKKEVGGGSGFIVSEDGYVVTNKHVVSDENAEYTVFLNDGTKYEGKVLSRDPLNDIAILKIDANKLPYLTFADSDKIKVGQSVIAIGNPLLEFQNSVSVGVVSGLARSITAGDSYGGSSEQLEGVIQTDAAINPGNSGGPLLNLNGEVIGVNVAVASAENIGFSLPSNIVGKVFNSVKTTGKIIRPYLGVRYIQINEALKKANNLSVDYGVLVAKGAKDEELAVIPGSPADKANLVENDIILEADGKKLDGKTSLANIIGQKNVGDTVKLKVLSKGKEKTVDVKLDEVPQS